MTTIESSQLTVERFCRLLWEEIQYRARSSRDNSYLRPKYEDTFFTVDGAPIHLQVASHAGRLAPLIREVRRRRGLRMLEAGCGCGSESILASLLGAEVVGVDLVPVRIDTARSRLDFYRSAIAGDVRLDFVCANVCEYLGQHPGFDLIWANESISHIHPAEQFLACAHNALKPGGRLLIADSNAANPVARIRAARLRAAKHWYVTNQFRMKDDAPHDDVAEERIFTVFEMTRKMTEAGFLVREVHMQGFLGSFFLPTSWQACSLLTRGLCSIQTVLQHVPGLRYLGSCWIMVGEKPSR